MGEEWGAREAFTYFCDFKPELAAKVRAGREQEFAGFARLRGSAGALVPDAAADSTFESARLYWVSLWTPVRQPRSLLPATASASSPRDYAADSTYTRQ